MSQLIDWQRSLNAAREKAGVELVRLASGAKAWVALEQQKRAMKMLPVPRPVDVSVSGGRGSRGRRREVLTLPDVDVEPPEPSKPAPCCAPPPPVEESGPYGVPGRPVKP